MNTKLVELKNEHFLSVDAGMNESLLCTNSFIRLISLMSIISVSPEEIVFPNVPNQEAVFILKVKNNTSSSVSFKVKTTAPKNYLVKPSAGTIPGNGTSDIKITLNKQVIDMVTNTDRFLVQAVRTDNGKELTKEEWSSVDKASIQELRLHVSFSSTAGSQSGSGYVPTIRSADTGAPNALLTQPLSKEAPSDQVREKYDELVTFGSQLDKERKRLETELEQCRVQLRKSRAVTSVSGSGFSALQLIVAMMLAVILARVATIMGY
jgi:vesicle-associated membrane protein-associated protein B